MIHSIAEKIAIKIKEQNPTETADVEVMAFSMSHLLSNLTVNIISLIIGYITGVFWETLIVLIVSGFLKGLIGGFHFQSIEVCAIFSILTTVVTPHIPVNEIVQYVLLSVSLVLIVLLAPVGENWSRFIKEKHYKWLKIVALLLVVSNFFIGSAYLTLTYAIQTILLLPTAMKGGENS